MHIKNKLKSIVDKLLKENLSGVQFFDKLDELIKEETDIVIGLIDMVPKDHAIAVSGGFGLKINELIESGKVNMPYIFYKGGIRSGAKPEILKNKLGDYNNLIFLDDTIYGGKTYFDIKEHAEEIGLNINSALVVYDGTPIKKDFVNSIYRYYDYYNSKPNFNF